MWKKNIIIMSNKWWSDNNVREKHHCLSSNIWWFSPTSCSDCLTITNTIGAREKLHHVPCLSSNWGVRNLEGTVLFLESRCSMTVSHQVDAPLTSIPLRCSRTCNHTRSCTPSFFSVVAEVHESGVWLNGIRGSRFAAVLSSIFLDYS